VRKVMALVAVVALVGMMPAMALAQQGRTEIRGSVTDEQGGALPGVTVLLTNEADGTFREVITGGEGTYFAAQLLNGTYTVTATLPGFSTFEQNGFNAAIGQTQTLPIVLTVGQLEETVTVSGQAPLVDLTSAEVGGTVAAAELVDLPLVNRSAFAAISMLPGLQFQPSSSQGNDTIIANGQTTSGSSLNLDGGNNADSTSGGGGGSQVKVAIEAVSEFQVITNQFDAEFGRASGAIVNAVTKRGTNQFSGAMFSYSTGTAMTARDYFNVQKNLTKPQNSKYEFGGVLGGPIVQDRAHFFASVERRMANPGRTRVFNTRPDLDRSSSEVWRAWNTMIRADHQINGNHSWAMRWMRELSPESNTFGGSNRTAVANRDILDDEWIAVGTYTAVIGNSMVNTARVTRMEEIYSYGNPCWRDFQGGQKRNGQMANCYPSLQHDSFRDNTAPWAGGRNDLNWQWNNTTSIFVPDMGGDHDFKFGATFHQTTMVDYNESLLGGTFRMAGDNPFDIDDYSTYPDRLEIRVGADAGRAFDYPINTWEAFFQDKWTVNDRLTIGLGMRWDAEMLMAKRVDNPLMTPGTDPRDWNNFSPRTSIAYDVNGDGRSVFRVGYGQFYDRTLFSGLDNVMQDPVINDSFEVTFPRAFNRDAGPTAGLPITDAELLGALTFGTGAACGPWLARDGGTQCPLVNHAYIDSLYPSTSTLRNEARVYVDNNRRKQPWFHQFTVGYEREVMPTLSVSVDYVNMRGRDLLGRISYNMASRDGIGKSDPLTWSDVFGELYGRTDTVNYEAGSFVNRVLSIQSIGKSSYDAFNFALEKRFANRWGARVSYALGHSRGDTFEQYGTNGPSLNGLQTQVGSELNMAENWQPSETDRRHVLTLSGRTEFPGGITANAILRYMTKLPFTLYNSTIDTNMNGSFWDPLPAGTYSADPSGNNPISGMVHNGRQGGARGADFMQLDLRFGYRIRPSGIQTIDIYLDVINLTNRVNFNNPSNDQNAGSFLNYTSLRSGGFPRQANFGIRYGF